MKVWTRRPGTYAGAQRDMGEVFDLPTGPKQEQLVRLGYLEKFTGRSPVKCGDCGAKFSGDADRNRHGQKRHRGQPVRLVRDLDDLGPEELRRLNENGKVVRYGEHGLPAGDPDLEAMEREEKEINERAPIYLEKTAASRK